MTNQAHASDPFETFAATRRPAVSAVERESRTQGERLLSVTLTVGADEVKAMRTLLANCTVKLTHREPDYVRPDVRRTVTG